MFVGDDVGVFSMRSLFVVCLFCVSLLCDFDVVVDNGLLLLQLFAADDVVCCCCLWLFAVVAVL